MSSKGLSDAILLGVERGLAKLELTVEDREHKQAVAKMMVLQLVHQIYDKLPVSYIQGISMNGVNPVFIDNVIGQTFSDEPVSQLVNQLKVWIANCIPLYQGGPTLH